VGDAATPTASTPEGPSLAEYPRAFKVNGMARAFKVNRDGDPPELF
jgi:hypothetical protein